MDSDRSSEVVGLFRLVVPDFVEWAQKDPRMSVSIWLDEPDPVYQGWEHAGSVAAFKQMATRAGGLLGFLPESHRFPPVEKALELENLERRWIEFVLLSVRGLTDPELEQRAGRKVPDEARGWVPRVFESSVQAIEALCHTSRTELLQSTTSGVRGTPPVAPEDDSGSATAPPGGEEWITVTNAAALTKENRGSISKAADKGHIRTNGKKGTQRRLLRDSALDWAQKQGEERRKRDEKEAKRAQESQPGRPSVEEQRRRTSGR